MSDGASCACLKASVFRIVDTRTGEFTEAMKCTMCGNEFVSKRLADARLAEARALLGDFLEERNESWLAQLAGRREELLASLWPPFGSEFNEARGTTCEACNRPRQPAEQTREHERECRYAELLRIVGGAAEVARQVEASHEVALYDRWPSRIPRPHFAGDDE